MASTDTSEQRKSAISVGNQFGRLFGRSSWRVFWRLNWVGGADVAIGRLLACGAFVWSAYSIAQIMLNGVVIDEVLAPAQVIAGAIQYPQGHPHQIYYIKAYNLFHYLAAGVWAIKPAPLAISAARNFLFLFTSAFAPFAIAVLLTRAPMWGHVASALTVTEASLRFEGLYPMWVFPSGNSNGHLGLYAAILIVVLLLARLWRTGGLLLGMLPAIHPVMPLVIWPWSGAYLLFSREPGARESRAGLARAIGVGLGVCAALAFIIFIRSPDSSATPPYDVQGDGELIHRQFTATTDVHRRLAPLWWYAYSVGPVALLAIGLLLLWTPKRTESAGPDFPNRRVCFWLMALGGIASIYVYGAWALQYWNGALPDPIGMSMPYRFANITTLLLAPFTVAAIGRAHAAMDGRAARVAMGLMAGLVFLAGIDFFSDRHPETLYTAWGLLIAMDFYAYRRHPRRRLAPLVVILAIGGVTVAIGGPGRIGDQWITLMKYLLAAFVIGFLGLVMASLKLRREEGSWERIAILTACLVASLAALPRSSQDQLNPQMTRWDMISQYDRDLSQWLAGNSRPGEMILAAIQPQTKLQPRVNHPALLEVESLYLMSYMPGLAPVIGAMTRDLYGVDYADRDQIRRLAPNGRLGFSSPVWRETWKNRKRDEWQELGRKYNFRFVIAPGNAPLDLPVALPGPFWSLYEIP